MAIINQRTNGEITKHDLKDLDKERNLIHVAENKCYDGDSSMTSNAKPLIF